MTDIDRAAWFIHESNLIEDVTALSRDDIRRRLAANSPLGHAGAFLFLDQLATERLVLRQQDLFLAHRLILLEELELSGGWEPADGIPEDLAPEIGGWRRRDIRVGLHAPTMWPVLPSVMGQYFDQLEAFLASPHADEEAIDFAADTHYEYEAVHPLIDGNGRTGRLIANYALAFHGLQIAVFTAADRQASYYSACNHPETTLMRRYLRCKMRHPDIALDAASSEEWPVDN